MSVVPVEGTPDVAGRPGLPVDVPVMQLVEEQTVEQCDSLLLTVLEWGCR